MHVYMVINIAKYLKLYFIITKSTTSLVCYTEASLCSVWSNENNLEALPKKIPLNNWVMKNHTLKLCLYKTQIFTFSFLI